MVSLKKIGHKIVSYITPCFPPFHVHIYMLVKDIYVGFYRLNLCLQVSQVFPNVILYGLFIDDCLLY